jgi:Tfp pilus assembly protein PilV
MRRQQKPPPASGFTLVEVMLGAGVLVIALIGMIQVIVSGSEMLDVSRKQTIAVQIIHGQIEQMRLLTWSQVEYLYENSGAIDVHAGDTSYNTHTRRRFYFGSKLPEIAEDFTLTRTITDVRTDLKQITWTVTWTGNTGRTYSRTGSTYVGKNGLYVTFQRT